MINKIDNLPFVNQKNALYLLLAMHIAGTIGLSIPETQELFKILTPFNLVGTAAIVLHFEERKSIGYGVFILVTFIVGFSIEVLGVQTGAIFGDYSYGKTLGFKLFNVPLAIGLNWIVLIYCTAQLSKQMFENTSVRILFGSFLMIVADLLIEPVAIAYDFWNWQSVNIPLQNYLAWFLISALLHAIFSVLMKDSNNPLAVKLFYIQVGFFLLLNFVCNLKTIFQTTC